MYVLANQPTSEDIIQLALLLPDTSVVYLQAFAMTTATLGKDKSWFQWRYVRTIHLLIYASLLFWVQILFIRSNIYRKSVINKNIIAFKFLCNVNYVTLDFLA